MIIFKGNVKKMKVKIIEVETGRIVDAIIQKASLKEMPLKKDGWQFTWRSLYKTEGADIYVLKLERSKNAVEGVIMLSMMYDEMLYMNNVEVSPTNIGKKGKYDHVAGCLIAFGSLQSIKLGKNTYKGYLTFESKTSLIELYLEKYRATLAMGQKMFIDPIAGEQLILKYLNQ